MKKIILIVMVAIGFMACNEPGANLPKKDKKAIQTATSDVASMIGLDKQAVEKTFLDAGFVEVEEAEGGAAIKAKSPRRAKKAEEAVQYLYGSYAKLQSDGDVIVIAIAFFDKGKLTDVGTAVYAGIADKINLLYTDASDKLFQQLPKDAVESEWGGQIKEPRQVFEDHAKFVAAIAAADSVFAVEKAYALTESGKSFAYEATWGSPMEQEPSMVAGIFFAGKADNPMDE